MSFFSSLAGISTTNVAMTIPLIVLLMLSITPPTDQAILDDLAILDCPLDAMGTTQEFPGVLRFPIPPDSDSIPPEFRAVVGTEFTRPKDHQYPTVRFCPDSVLVINRTSPLSPFQTQPYFKELLTANMVRQFQGYPYISAEPFLAGFHPLPHTPLHGRPKDGYHTRKYLPKGDVLVHNNVFEDYQREKFCITSSLKTLHGLH